MLGGGWVACSYRRDLKDQCLFFFSSPKIDDMRSRGGGGGGGGEGRRGGGAGSRADPEGETERWKWAGCVVELRSVQKHKRQQECGDKTRSLTSIKQPLVNDTLTFTAPLRRTEAVSNVSMEH